MSPITRAHLGLPHSQYAWALLSCRLMALLAAQGLVVLVLYALMGPTTQPVDLPPGLQIDPLHAAIHLVSGAIGGYIGFWRPSAAIRFIQLFAVVYLPLAVFGTFTAMDFGMQLKLGENGFHWTLALIAAAIGFGPLLVAVLRPR